MGYTTDFAGQIRVEPPLSPEEVEYLNTFSGTRRMNRENGPYYAKDDGDFGQSNGPDKVFDHNSPPAGQPGLWCQWVSEDGGETIEWDGGEKFYNAAEWMAYIIEHFVGSEPKAADSEWTPDLPGHVLNGEIIAQGEDTLDRWKLIVVNNEVTVESLE